ncbi:DUF3667 domain-containing protein [Antarcticibacterium sp. 1MA-6-2]|uniref:DUF3667 domain-containing protein n=1 Tax=Antarcticibacterium sp. 1MA-6-2 TaxID=2908210 RepID=UPI001F270D63|nr:DUF3667 domain-containing protein [Antarcticibacterium sp. 1MA-6-2]UJH91074.1 DUF3667 domain-containing protein [Antarcticibacterium sp. 1MA-6-2]
MIKLLAWGLQTQLILQTKQVVMALLQQKNPRTATNHRGNRCLNCEHPLDTSDKFCPQCGQVNSTKKLSFDDFFNEFFAGLFAYDSRIRRTLTTILFYPGKISCEYIFGKRVRYANPFRFYLSASIIFFIIWNFTGDYDSMLNNSTNNNTELTAEEREELKEDLKKVPGGEAINIDSLIAAPAKTTGRVIEISDSLEATSQGTAGGNYMNDYISQEKLDSLPWYNSLISQTDYYNSFYKETSLREPFSAIDSLNHTNSTYNRWIYKKVVDWNSMRDNPSIFYNYFVSKLPFIIFFYLPIFALFIWLLYLRRPFNYMEHLVFAFHVQTTFFIMMALGLILDYIFSSDTFTEILTFIFLFYLYKAMRKFYCQGRFKTIVKFILLNGIFTTLAIIAALFSLTASFAIF